MNYLLVTFCSLLIVGLAAAEPTEPEVVSLMNRVQSRVAGGDIKAVNELTTLPGKWSTPALLTIFKQNYNIFGARCKCLRPASQRRAPQ